MFFFRISILVLLEFVCRRAQNFTITDQEKQKIKQIYILEPHDYRIYYVNIDLRHQYGISVTKSGEMSLAARSKEKRVYSQATRFTTHLLCLDFNQEPRK